MSAARVLNPVLSRNLPCGRQLNRIKRDLFGPANPNETTRIFSEELEKQQEKACKKWGFDFRAGLPIQCNSQFVWERVSFPECNYTPEMYTLTRAAHVRPTIPQPTSLDILMDERSERENFVANISGSSATDTDSCDDSQDESMPVVPFKLPAAITGCNGGSAGLGMGMGMEAVTFDLNRLAAKRRQPKITEYMKERKRLAQTPKKLNSSPPAKRMRTTTTSSSSGSHQHSISMHFTMQRNHQHHNSQQQHHRFQN